MGRNAAFADDIFTRQEQKYCRSHRNPHVFFAGRFAAKEAYLKAIGTGFLTIGIFGEIEVLNLPSGRPVLGLSGWARTLMGRLSVHNVSVSISHTPEFAVSSVILTGVN